MKPVVLVLEDMHVRVQWLRSVVGKAARVVWARGVRSFLRLSSLLQDRIAVIILDHDLEFTTSKAGPLTLETAAHNPRGLTGLNAARALVTRAPVLVWSLNFYPGEVMQAELRRKGVFCALVPFLEKNKVWIEYFVQECIRSAWVE